MREGGWSEVKESGKGNGATCIIHDMETLNLLAAPSRIRLLLNQPSISGYYCLVLDFIHIQIHMQL